MPATTFHEIPVCLENGIDQPHTLFVKRHIQKDVSECKTLFIVNIPCYCNKTGLMNIFSECGNIINIKLTDSPAGNIEENDVNKQSKIFKYLKKKNSKFKYAYITFKDTTSVDIALEMSSSNTRYISTEENPVVTGINKWVTNYKLRFIDENLLEADADEYLRKYDMNEWKRKEALKNSTEADDEGWVTIPLKKKAIKPQNDPKFQKQDEKNKRKEKELMNFYLFQQREAKRDKVAELRKQFEEDKKRITQMRQLRKFKPF